VHVASRASVSAITATGARTTLALSAAPHRSEHQRSGCATEVFVGARTWRAGWGAVRRADPVVPPAVGARS